MELNKRGKIFLYFSPLLYIFYVKYTVKFDKKNKFLLI